MPTPTDPNNPAIERDGTPLYDAAQDRMAQVDHFLAMTRAWPINLRPGDGKAAAVVALADGLRVIADEFDPS